MVVGEMVVIEMEHCLVILIAFACLKLYERIPRFVFESKELIEQTVSIHITVGVKLT